MEFFICFFSRHDFIVSPEFTQYTECRRCHRPYAETLQDKRQRGKQKLIEIPCEAPSQKALEVSTSKK
jgi:hypothetical protein